MSATRRSARAWAMGFDAAAPDRHGPGGVSDKAVVNDTAIQADNVPEFDSATIGQAVHHLLIDGDAKIARKFLVAQKSALGTVVLHARGGKLINIARSHTGLDEVRDLVQHRAGDHTCRPHGFQIAFALENDHLTAAPRR
jgi:hypothetical protein